MNARTDEDRGDLEGRLRFVRELIRAVPAMVGSDFSILFRFSADEHVPGGIGPEEAVAIGQTVVATGVDALHVCAGIYEAKERISPPMFWLPPDNVPFAARLGRAVSVRVIVVGKLGGDPWTAAQVIREGDADFVALGSPPVADPHWPVKAATGAVERIRLCIYRVERIERPAENVNHIWAYVDVRDVATAVAAALDATLPEVSFTVNIEAGDVCGRVPSGELIAEYYPDVPSIRNDDGFVANPYAPLYGIDRARRVLGYTPAHTWREYKCWPAVPGSAGRPTPLTEGPRP